jgi:methylthioribulose-1-phosphate dehydratase
MTDNSRQILVDASRYFYQLGWMGGTAGNLSIRDDLQTDRFWITASGKGKGQLTETDFVRVSLLGELLESPHPDNHPSAETSIHQAVYYLFPEAKVCYHVHSVEANLVSNFSNEDELELPPVEIIKGLGIWEENPQVKLPLFTNYLHVPKIAEEIVDRFRENQPRVPALLIRNHGITVWGSSPLEARNRVESIEFIFRYMVAARQLGLSVVNNN